MRGESLKPAGCFRGDAENWGQHTDFFDFRNYIGEQIGVLIYASGGVKLMYAADLQLKPLFEKRILDAPACIFAGDTKLFAGY